MKVVLITLSSPIAIALPNKQTKLVNVVVAEIGEPSAHSEVLLRVHKYYDSGTQDMQYVRSCHANGAMGAPTIVEVRTRATNIRSKQEVA